MAETLYRKYRPQIFADVAEQEHILRTITKQLATNTVAHAYLFSGPRGVGKTTIARLLAKALNCEKRIEGTFEPCNECSACLDFVQGRMLSCVEIDAASQTGVDNVRENIIENARFAPTRGKYKVFILDEVHMLSSSSFNALLKTLEEPPSHAIFILATTELHKIPATIASRCQRFEFHRVAPVVMMPRLAKIAVAEGVQVDDDVLAQISRLSEGCLRDGESLLGQVVALGEKHITKDIAMLVLPMTNLALVADMIEHIADGELKVAIDKLNAFVNDGGSVKHLVEEMLEYIRAVMFAALGDTSNDLYDEKTLSRIRSAASTMGTKKACTFLDALLVARVRQSLPAIPQIPLEIAILGLDTIEGPSRTYVRDPQPVSAPVSSAPSNSPLLRGRDLDPVVSIAPAVSMLPEQSAPSIAPLRYDFEQATKDRLANAAANIVSSIPLNSAAPAFPLSEIVDKWERCCAYVAERNVALPLILRGAKPASVDGDVVTISCQYAFHSEALKDAKARLLIEAAILDVLQKAVTIVSVHIPQKAESDAVTSFVSELGGTFE
ncbi:MAG: DNA polymerase III subunit gamma/tau [Patescibacteria group bacterium]|jgi:DNA polymerase-3 subunit gamma/tau